MRRFGILYFLIFPVTATFVPYFAPILESRGFDKPQIGLLVGLSELTGMVGPIVLGWLADRHGKRRTTLLLCMIGFALSMLPLHWVSGMALAGVLTAMIGFTFKPTIPLADALAVHELPDPARQYGPARALGSLGFVVTLLVIRRWRLVDESSSASMLRAAMVAVAICLPAILAVPDRHRSAPRDGSAAEPAGLDRIFWAGLFIVFLGRLGMSSHYAFFTLYLREALHMESAAWVWSVGAIGEIPFIFMAAWLVRRVGLRWMLMLSMLAIVVRLGVYATVPVLGVIAPIQLLHGITFGMLHCASIEFIRRKVSRRSSGLGMALYMSVGLGLPALIGSSLGGFIIKHWGYSTMFGLYTIAPAISAVIIGLCGRRLFGPSAVSPAIGHRR